MSTEENTFVKATKRKVRFQTTKGSLSTEDLWDLSLESLDKIAVAIDEEIQKEGRRSFIATRTTSNTLNNLKLDVLKYIIQAKQEEEETKKVRADKLARKKFLESLLEKKKVAALETLSAEEIEKQLAALTD